MSTVRARNSGREDIVEGISFLEESEQTLAELIEQYPEQMLGKEHYEKYGNKLGVLVKLIDAGERLTVQVHPTREKARKLFDSPFGKTECWHIIGGRTIDGEAPCIYFGFKKGITRKHWKEIFDTQDIDAMLDCLHKFYVKPGDTFLIEGGIPHAIGAGCFLVEIQEPTDYTIRTEKVTPNGLAVSDFMCHQGLGFDKMFDCFDYCGYTEAEIRDRWCIKPTGNSVVRYENTEMFRLEELKVDGQETICSNGVFSGIYILDGEGTVNGEHIKKGAQYFIPACCSDFTVEGKMKLMRFYGPKV